MFQGFRQTARRAASNSNKTISASVVSSSIAAGAAVLLALASGSQPENDDNIEANDPLHGETQAPKPLISSLSAIPSTSICQCELSAHLSPNDMRLRRAVTSKLMAAEATAKTFFSLYEVDFDHPLGSGAYGDVYLCRERSSGEECALKKIPKVRLPFARTTVHAHPFCLETCLFCFITLAGIHRTRRIPKRNERPSTYTCARRPSQYLHAARKL